MNIQIDWVEEKTSSKGVLYKKASVTDGDRKYEDVAVFNYYSKYAEVIPGATVEGVIQEGRIFQGKPSYTLTDGNLGAKPASMRKESTIAKAQERKAEFIEKAQDNKDNAVKVASTMNKAVDLTIAFPTYWDVPNKEEQIIKWREWLWKHWDDPQQPF